MKPRISPILINNCPAMGWKIDPKKSALENVEELLHKLMQSMETLRKRKLPAEKHLAERDKLKKAQEETGLGTAGTQLLSRLILEPAATKLNQKIAKLDEVTLLREALGIMFNNPKVKAKSHTYGEAWAEVEGNYCLKISLYQAEIARRKNNKK